MIKNTNHTEFDSARQYFEHVIELLSSEETLQSRHDVMESMIDQHGTELLRLLFQAVLDTCSRLEPRRPSVKNEEGKELTRCRKECKRQLQSKFGEVSVSRKGYSLPKHHSEFPLDSLLNLPPNSYSHGLRKRVAEEAAKSSFDELVATIDSTTGGHVPKRQAEELLVDIAVDFEQFYETRTYTDQKNTDDILAMSCDGKGIPMINKDLREPTRRAAEEKQKHGRLKPGEKSNRKRMSTVATVYDVAPHVRTAEDMIGSGKEKKPKPAKTKRPKPSNKRVFASIEKNTFDVVGEMFSEALRRDPTQQRPWVVLLDGAEHQLELVRHIIREAGFSVTIILDLIHVIEYIWGAAHGFFSVGSNEAKQWVETQVLNILNGKAVNVAKAIKRRADKLGYSKAKRQGIDKCTAYLLKYKDFLNYNQYLAKGFPIATGVVEGACRHLVKDRMELTGARWGLRTAEAVLKIRSLRSSGDFEEYWTYHLKNEHKRHYSACGDDYHLAEAA